MAEQVAVVTGGNRGIGRSIATLLASSGIKVAATYRSASHAELDAMRAEGLHPIRCDVSSTDSVDAAFDLVESDLGPVTIAVANAGLTRDGLIMRMPDDDLDVVLETNLKGAFRVARRASRSMIRARGGRIIFIGSVVSHLGSAGQSNYAASKGALVGLARSLARELGPRSIAVNVVSPGFITTDMTEEITQQRQESIVSSIPLGRFGTTSDVAHAVAFLASPAAAYISGAVIPVDGGLGMGH